jgi:hypothetical protein
MVSLQFTKSLEAFKNVAAMTKAFSNMGPVLRREAILYAQQYSEKVEVGRKWAWTGEKGTSVMVGGIEGHVLFDSSLNVKICDNYKSTAIYKQKPDLLINLLEYAFYEGYPMFALIEALDKQVQCHEQNIDGFVKIHESLVRLQLS